MKILIIDDSSLQRKIIGKIIHDSGFTYEIREAKNGQEGLQVLSQENQEIGLILCDWNMPEMKGIEFLKEFAKNEDWKKIPVIMVTTEATPSKIEEARQVLPQLKGYITKPFQKEKLKQVFESVLKP